MRRGRLPDPSWKSGPKEPKPSASEHAIHPEDFGHAAYDFDGFGRDEVEMVEGEPLITIRESVECHRDGCDAFHSRVMLFTTDTLSDDEKHALDVASAVDEPAAYVWDRAERVDAETIRVDDTFITPERVIENEASGQCYGRVEPDVDVNAHRYDL